MSSLTAPSLGALGGTEKGSQIRWCTSPRTFGVPGPVLTWQTVDEPAQLFLGDIGPAEVQGDGLPPDDAAQHQGRDGPAVVQVDAGP